MDQDNLFFDPSKIFFRNKILYEEIWLIQNDRKRY